MFNPNLYSGFLEMRKWVVDITNFEYTKYKDVHQVLNPNYADLRREIMSFNDEIKWDGMWTHYDAIERLSKGWVLIGLFVNYQIKGWVWLDTNKNLLCNLYVNKSYRNFYNAKKLVLTLMRVAHEMGFTELHTEIDTWNGRSELIAIKTGWKLQNEH
jgi:hypothetical protein